MRTLIAAVLLVVFLGSGLASASERDEPGIGCECPQYAVDPPSDPLPDFDTPSLPGSTAATIWALILFLASR